MTDLRRSEPLRVAIVGAGPKGMYALERLLDRAATRTPDRPIEIEVFEPHPVPGAGHVYDPGQPPYLKMNFSADRVNVWPDGSCAVPAEHQLSFDAWRSRQRDSGDEDYPPRAQVGRYLAECFTLLLRHAPAEVSIRVQPERVTSVASSSRGWAVLCRDTSAEFDEVMLATGHAADWAGALRHGWNHAAPLVEAVFPVERMLTAEAIRPGARVGARGFALTFIDMALALTEGRGGAFEPDGSRLRYRPAGSEPALILPFSRTGQPMLAKPRPGASVGGDEWERATQRARAEVRAIARADAVAALTGVVAQLAAHSDNPAGEPAAASGAAWRAIYPAVVERFGGRGLEAAEWRAFHELAAAMERVSFGPPPLNVAKLAALIEAGIVDTTHAREGRIETADGRTQLHSPAGHAAIDVVVDAVLPPPGVVGVDVPVFGPLVGAGHAGVPAGQRGIEVTADATCVGVTGVPTTGLAACGRPTEDSVIGNDTLSRDLHPQFDRWADRLMTGTLDRATRIAA